MISLIWLRHGEKKYANCKGGSECWQLDSPLKPSAREENCARAHQLIQSYGVPTHCITSPYQRARETASHLIECLPAAERPLLHVDVNVGEYLGNQKLNVELKTLVNPITFGFGKLPPLRETFSALHRRCSAHLELFDFDRLKDAPANHRLVVWIVSHGIVTTSIYKELTTIVEKLGLAVTIPSPESRTLWGSSGPEALEGFVFSYTSTQVPTSVAGTGSVVALPPLSPPTEKGSTAKG